MCQSCTPQKLTRTYSKGLVVQVLGKPLRPYAATIASSPRNSSSPTTTEFSSPCSPRSSAASYGDKPVGENSLTLQLQDQTPEKAGSVASPRSGEAKSMKVPSWKMFAGGEQITQTGDGEIGESDMDVDTDTPTSSSESTCQGQRCMELRPADYASKYRTCWC
ncbi:hypothetical protein R1sor_019446 [Riccia sorocarpa]|uniref:Uncharacterized protein n=1 Tax=Riccia sorocarpa TaxID=122646 RepID=A0ABD3IE91_9MARC